jgi:uncharacterized protein YbjT (DUF2867 family)
MYAVMGVTGKVGAAAAAGLLQGGARVRAIMRDADKSVVWTEKGCEVALARTESAADLTAALQNVAGAFVMLPPIFDPQPGFPEARRAVESIRRSLEQARPPKVVCLSTIGADAVQPNLLNQLSSLEEGLRCLPMPVTFLRPAWFLDNAAFDTAAARTTGRIDSFLQPLDKQYPMVAARDVGSTAAELLRDTWSGHRVVELAGPDEVTANGIAEAFSASLAAQVTARVVPREDWERLFREQGMKNPTPRMQMLDGFNEGWIAFSDGGKHVRRGTTTLGQVITSIVAAR